MAAEIDRAKMKHSRQKPSAFLPDETHRLQKYLCHIPHQFPYTLT